MSLYSAKNSNIGYQKQQLNFKRLKKYARYMRMNCEQRFYSRANSEFGSITSLEPFLVTDSQYNNIVLFSVYI